MYREQYRFLQIADKLVDALLNAVMSVCAYILALTLVPSNAAPDITDIRTSTVLFIILLMIALVYPVAGVYRDLTYQKMHRAVGAILRANGVCAGALALAVCALSSGERSRFLLVWIVLWLILCSLLLSLKRKLELDLLEVFHRNRQRTHTAILVGDNPASAAEYLRTVSEQPQYGVTVLGMLGNKLTNEIGCEKLGAFEDLETVLDKYRPDMVVFAIDAYNKRSLIRLVNICDDHCVRVYFLPVIYGFFKSPKQLEQMGDLPLVNIHATPLDNPLNATLKRLVDFFGSLILILLTSPLMLAATIGIKLTSPGPVFFRQKRLGIRGKPFTMYKFRSMQINDQSDSAWSAPGDVRVTKFGAFLRATSMDELPQLFNVLLGSMSLVGPRPEIPKFVNYFRNIVPLYMVKHSVKPGMTGLAQIKGLRGDTSVEERIRQDISYIENWSFSLDLGILFLTPLRAFNKSEWQGHAQEKDAQEKDTQEKDFPPSAHDKEDSSWEK